MKRGIYKKVLDSLDEGVYFVDRERKITFWNKGAERISGYKSGELLNTHCYNDTLQHVDDVGTRLCKNGCPLHKTIADGKKRDATVYLHHKEGHRVKVKVQTLPIKNSKNEVVGAVETFTDKRRKVKDSEEINYLKELALRDQLTNLPNRRYINDILKRKIDEFNNLDISFGLLFVDIDNFKAFNDNYGHHVGDRALKMVAETFESALRQSDIVGRWGGEEFVIICNGANEDFVKKIAEKIRLLIKKSYCKIDGEEISISVSIGATLIKKGDDFDSIVKRADKLMYKSKNNGKDQVTIA